MKLFIAEEEKNNIRSMYGIVNEQTITLPLPISDTFQSYDGDSAHKLTGLETKIDFALKQIYNQGINPKMYDVKLKVVRNGNTFTTTSSLMIDKSDDGKAWTGFASRGSIGYDYVNRADGQIDGSGNADGRSLEEKLKSGADAVEIIPISNSPITINNVQLKQYFVQFTKSLKPSHTSSKPKAETPNSSEPAKSETPKSDEPVKTVAPKPVEAPKTATPKSDEPVKTVAPKPVEAPKPAEPVKAVTSKPVEAPKTVTPKPAGAPKTATPAKRANILTINPNDF